MSKRRDLDYLQDIAEAISMITTYTQGLTFNGFMKDRKTQDAVIRNFEIIGEATKKLSASLRRKYPQVPWKKFAGLRDKVIHHYFGIKYDIIWQVKVEFPTLIPQIKEIIEKETEKT
jgi:uncharacterized protein with HEPN domain